MAFRTPHQDTPAQASNPNSTMKLPAGVVANDEYVGSAPAPPAIPVPMTVHMGKWSGRIGAYSGDLPSRAAQAPSCSGDCPPDQYGHGSVSVLDSITIANCRPIMIIQPCLPNAGLMGLTEEELLLATGNREQVASDQSTYWDYEMRRFAHPVLDFLYLGPSAVARDRAFLQRTGVTMLLAARDSRLAELHMMSANRTVADLDLEARHIDIPKDGGPSVLIKVFLDAVRTINAHLLSCAAAHRKPCILVFCETGNDRSATLVAAYLMAAYGLPLIKALQFVSMQRFCAIFSEEHKQALLSYGDILKARRDVAAASTPPAASPALPDHTANRPKRSIDDAMDIDDNGPETPDDSHLPSDSPDDVLRKARADAVHALSIPVEERIRSRMKALNDRGFAPFTDRTQSP